MKSSLVGRTVLWVEQVEIGIGCDRVVFVDDRRVHPRRQHIGAAGVRGAGHITVGGRQVGKPSGGPHAFKWRHVGVDRLRLVGRHQRATAGVAEQHNGFHSLDLA